MQLKNKFNLHELSAAVADLGILLPISFALIVFNGYSASTLFLSWGLVYIATGYFFKVSLSVQPLKAMAVIAIANGFDSNYLATTSILFACILLLLNYSGMINWLKKIFSFAIIRGIQVGIGLILVAKSIDICLHKGLFVFDNQAQIPLNLLIYAATLLLIYILQFYMKLPATFFVVVLLSLSAILCGVKIPETSTAINFSFIKPDFSIGLESLFFLIIPQLPLTLGNAIYAANDSCHSLYGKQAAKINPERLTISMALSNIAIGFLGSFPICHGAGGIAAHYRFGARSGAASIILGIILITLTLIKPDFIFYIPSPCLAALLLVASFEMLRFIVQVDSKISLIIAVSVALISFMSNNLLAALLTGLSLELITKFTQIKESVK